MCVILWIALTRRSEAERYQVCQAFLFILQSIIRAKKSRVSYHYFIPPNVAQINMGIRDMSVSSGDYL